MDELDILTITIGSGETVSGAVWDAGEVVVVAGGGTVSDTVLADGADSMTLGDGAIVSGTLTVSAPVAVEGDVVAKDAGIVLDISPLKEDTELLWGDYTAVAEASSWGLNVNVNQNKGTYRLMGNAVSFDKTITVTNSSGTSLGTLSLASSVLDFDVTRYTLGLNEAGELTVTISSNITDDSYYVFLYKDNHLVTPLAEGMDVTVSSEGDYDHLVIIEDGLAGNIKLQSGGVVTVYGGGTAVAIEQQTGGALRFDYAAGDSTLISGVNQHGSFLVQNDYLYNVRGENVTLSGDLTVENYYSTGAFASADGVDISGVFVSTGSATFKKGTDIHDCSVSGSNLTFEAGITVSDSTLSGGTIRGGAFSNVTIGSGYFYGGTFGDVTLTSGGTLYGHVTLDGTLTVQGNLNRGGSSGYIDAAGHTIVLDYRSRQVTHDRIMNGAYVSEDAVFCIDLLAAQGIGTYQVLGSADLRSKYSFSIRVDGEILGTLTHEATSFEYGDYVYTMTSGKTLTIDISANAGDAFNVLYWLGDGTFGHASELFTATVNSTDYKQVTVRKNGIAGDLLLEQGGLLEVEAGGFAVGVNQRDKGALRFDYASGDATVISGANQYGTFLVQQDLLLNVIGETVNLSGDISVQDYRSTGTLTAVDGVSFTGILDTGSKEAVFGGTGSDSAEVVIADAVVSGGKKTFYKGVSVSNTSINGTNDFRGGSYEAVTVSGSSYFYGGTFSDSVWQGGILASGAVELAGTLTITGNVSSGGGVINANGNAIVLDYTERTVSSGAIIALNRVSEDVVFDIAIKDEQGVGTYTIASNAGSFVDTFNITIDGDVIGTLDNENTSFDYGNFSYAMGWDNKTQNITLTIGISENADERFNVICYTSQGDLFYAKEMTDVVVDGTDCAAVTVRNGGWLANTKLQKGTLTVRNGAVVYGLEQSASGKLRFDYGAGDETLISGVNQYGTFLVQDDYMLNVAGENVTVTGDVLVEEYHSGGTFKGDGITVTGTFYGSGTFANTVFDDAVVTGTATVSGTSQVEHSTFASAVFSGGTVYDVTVSGSATVSGGTFDDVTLAGGGSIRGRMALEGRLIIGNSVTCVSSYSVNGAIDAAGHEVNLDLTERTPISAAMINLDRVYNADLTLTVYADQTLGTYTLGTDAEHIGEGNGEGYWDIDTNTWLYTDAVQGDLDGVITVRSDQGIELARCTVNGATEYFGRYNYRVYTDDEDQLKLTIGWNNREDLVFADDGNDNNTLATATMISGTGVQTLTGLTIHHADDVDYYGFTLERSGTAASHVTIAFKQWAGDLDMDLYDAAGNRITWAHSVTDNETISLQGLAAGDYYVKVSGDEGCTNAYTLTAELPAKPDFSDDYERGDTPGESHYLGSVSSETNIRGAISQAGDNDYYSFYLERRGSASDSVTLTFDPSLGDLDLYLYDGKGKRVLSKSVSTGSGSETISFKGLSKGSYMVRVVAKNGVDAADYKLGFSLRSSYVAPDKYENNNTLKKAKNLYALHGRNKNKNLSIHSSEDVDYFKFKLKETGTSDDWIAIEYDAAFGDLDIEILDKLGNVVAWSRTPEDTDTVSLEGLAEGDYYIRVTGYNGMTNTYDMSWNITNSKLIPSDSHEGHGPHAITQDQKLSGLTIAKPQKEDETAHDVFAITLSHRGKRASKVILTDFRSDWEEGMAWTLSTDPEGKNPFAHGVGSEISLSGLSKGTYYLTVDSPVEDEYSEYSVIVEGLPDNDAADEKNAWSVFVYLAGDNNLEGAYLTELLWMQQAVLPEGVEVYVLMDRSEGYSVGERNWSDTRVGKIVHSPGGAVAVQWLYFDGVDTDMYMNTSNLELRQEWDTGDVATLGAFLDWGMKTGEAENYALIMKNHGTSLGFNSSDETSGSIMSITDIAALLDDSKYDDLKVVAFDQCLMGSDVVITTLEGNVDYVVASESIGWTPNQLVMYKVLFNSLTADMTPQEMAQKIVKACNCSGMLDLTSASFSTGDSTLSGALNAFAGAASNFTRSDWVAICKSFALAYNYGDDICAFSDLGFLLNAIKDTSVTVSDALLTAVDTLYDVVIHDVIDSTMITPVSYGTGFAVFNPVQSSDLMTFYSYGPGATLDYYGTDIGESAWGQFLYTVGQLSDDCTEYFVDNRTQLTFTDFTYSFADDAVRVNYNLGTFYGDGVDFNGLYLDDSLYFTIYLDNAGNVGDALRITADNPDAAITMTLIQQRPIPLTGEIETIVRRVSEDGVLSLAGVDAENAGVLTEYFVTITTDKETTCDLSFEAQWTSGSDFFDYKQSGNQLGKQGNGSLDKATVLAAGNYGGLVTYKGDADYYRLTSVYSNEIDVRVVGSGLTVCEYDATGKLVRTAAEEDGAYVITIANGNFLYVEGDGELSAGNVNSYSMEVSDIAHTYLAPEGSVVALPTVNVSPNTTGVAREILLTAETEEGMATYVSTDLRTWELFDGTYTATANGLYYFKAVSPDSGLESNYTSVEVTTIDRVPPTLDITGASDTPTNQKVTLVATASDGVVEYLDGTEWVEGTTLSVSENGTYYFRAKDAAGNMVEKSVVVSNIDMIAPEAPVAVADITEPTNGKVTVTATYSDDSVIKEFSLDGKTWESYVGGIVLSANGSVHFRGFDEAGNVSAVTTYEVGNIDTIAPDAPVASLNTTEPTNQPVTVTVAYSEDSVVRQYRIGDGEWLDYTDAFQVSDNGTVQLRAGDAAGNVVTAEQVVSNIDMIAPEAPVASLNTTDPTNQPVTVTVAYSEDSVVRQYRIGDGEWLDYTDAFQVPDNGTVQLRAEDAAGNMVTAEQVVSNIDMIAPEVPVAAADITEPTNVKVTVTATYSDDSVIKEFSLDGQTWESYAGGIELSANGSVHFRGFDEAGNVSAVTTYEVGNIDTVAPDAPVASLNTTDPTNQPVTVTVAYSEDSVVRQYRIGDGEWLDYVDAFQVSDNGTVQLRAGDAAGNVVTAEQVVSNIDMVAPEAPVAAADITEPTNGKVTVTATYSDDSVIKEFSLDGKTWESYVGGIVLSANGSVHFRGFDEAGNVSAVTTYEVGNIDTVAPDAPVASLNTTDPTNQPVTVTVAYSEDSVVRQYRIGNGEWLDYTDAFQVSDNGTVQLRAEDAAGNVVTAEQVVSNIDMIAPEAPAVLLDFNGPTNETVVVSIVYSSDSVVRKYKIDEGVWLDYTDSFVVADNATIHLQAEDAAGNVAISTHEITNIDKVAPAVPNAFMATVAGYDVLLDWKDVADNGSSGVAGYFVRYGVSESLHGDGEYVIQSGTTFTDLTVGVYYYQVKALDKAGNASVWSDVQSFTIEPGHVQNLVGSADGVTWDGIAGVAGYVVEYSKGEDFADVVRLETRTCSVDAYALPSGTYYWRVRAIGGEFGEIATVVSESEVALRHLESNNDTNMDVFFANASGIWEEGYAAQHLGVKGVWAGTREYSSLAGKNKLSDIFEGSANDANVLVLTDDDHGDALFVDDIYTALPGTVEERRARIEQLDEIRAGAGDDIIDMTSQVFDYVGDGVTIYGGLGNDVIWANHGSNTLFGDAGHDWIVGGTGNDVIIGGSGNDRLHGGGGEDTFVFGGDWGRDTVEQLVGGSVVLWFEEGSDSNWDAETLTYTDGANRVKVRGVDASDVTLKFGEPETAVAGAFLEAASEKIFEDKEKGMLA